MGGGEELNKNILLDCLQEFTQEAVKDLLLPVSRQKEDGDRELSARPAAVYLMRLPDSKAAKKKAPYILHQVITGRDKQQPGKQAEANALVRTVFCVYDADEQEGGLQLLNLMERLRIALLQQQVIGGQFQLDLAEGLETANYPDDTAPYYLGEMISVWRLPGIQRQVLVKQ